MRSHLPRTSSRRAWSSRLPADLTDNPLEALRAATSGVVDLTATNPTTAGFVYPDISTAICGPSAAAYVPDAAGRQEARQQVAAYLRAAGHPISESQLVLCASTSEAYGWLFKLLCDPGDCIAAPLPCYPLIGHLAALEGVRVVPYRYVYEGGRWQIDLDTLHDARQPKLRAVVAISPHNPTGASLDMAQAQGLADFCGTAGVPLVLDEVFASYRELPRETPHATAAPRAAALLQGRAPLLFVLDGLSKLAALPQLKLGWIAVHGQGAAQALARLRYIADSYLSVSNAAQAALPAVLLAAPLLQAQVQARLRQNRRALADILASLPEADATAAAAGFHQVVRLPQHVDEETLCAALLRQAHVFVHPGYYYDFVRRGFLVTGLLLPPDTFAAAWQRAAALLQQLL